LSPTVFHYNRYRFFFFSKEEMRIHIHVLAPEGEAKFWLKPDIELAKNSGLSAKQITEILAVIKERQDEIRDAWQEHFSS
jgi:hypothetical protein